jgi:hypothetical protein
VPVINVLQKKNKGKTPAKAVAKEDIESDSSDSELEKAPYPVNNAKV